MLVPSTSELNRTYLSPQLHIVLHPTPSPKAQTHQTLQYIIQQTKKINPLNLDPRPRELRHPVRRNVSPQPILPRLHTDGPRSRSVPFTLGSESHRDDTHFQTLRCPIRARRATAPEADARFLGELRVVEEVGPHGEDDLRDAGTVV